MNTLDSAEHPRKKSALLGLRTRLLLILIPVLVALFAFDSWSDIKALGQELEKAYDQTLVEPAQALADSLDWNGSGDVQLTDSFHITSMFEAVAARAKYMRVVVKPAGDASPRVILGPAEFPEPPTDGAFHAREDGARIAYNTLYREQPIRVVALVKVVHDDQGRPWTALIQTARSTHAIDSAQHDLLMQTLRRDARTLVILVLIIWLGIGWGLRPLLALREAIRVRKPDELEPLQTGAVPGEVRPLVDAMNQHLEQQRESLETQRQFLDDASHQLRTPLAIMHTQTGYALRETDPAAIRSTLLGILQQLQRSRRVSEQLLSLAQAHQSAGPATSNEHELCDANTVAREVVIAHLPQALEKQIDLGWIDALGDDNEENDDHDDSDDNDEGGRSMVAPVRASALGLHEVLSNLVHNAIAYTPRGGKVSVSVHVNESQVIVRILDNGPGIAPQDRARAFKRFQRLQNSTDAGSAVPGSGLGLAIAQAYLQQMQGAIELLDGEDGVGLAVQVLLPLAVPSTAH